MTAEPTLEAPPQMSRDEMLAHLRAANAVALQAMAHGRHPFGAVLVGPDGQVLMRQGNLGTVRHAETELARRAAESYGPDFLWRCTLVSTFEPCAMCRGMILEYRIGHVAFIEPKSLWHWMKEDARWIGYELTRQRSGPEHLQDSLFRLHPAYDPAKADH